MLSLRWKFTRHSFRDLAVCVSVSERRHLGAGRQRSTEGCQPSGQDLCQRAGDRHALAQAQHGVVELHGHGVFESRLPPSHAAPATESHLHLGIAHEPTCDFFVQLNAVLASCIWSSSITVTGRGVSLFVDGGCGALLESVSSSDPRFSDDGIHVTSGTKDAYVPSSGLPRDRRSPTSR